MNARCRAPDGASAEIPNLYDGVARDSRGGSWVQTWVAMLALTTVCVLATPETSRIDLQDDPADQSPQESVR